MGGLEEGLFNGGGSGAVAGDDLRQLFEQRQQPGAEIAPGRAAQSIRDVTVPRSLDLDHPPAERPQSRIDPDDTHFVALLPRSVAVFPTD